MECRGFVGRVEYDAVVGASAVDEDEVEVVLDSSDSVSRVERATSGAFDLFDESYGWCRLLVCSHDD